MQIELTTYLRSHLGLSLCAILMASLPCHGTTNAQPVADLPAPRVKAVLSRVFSDHLAPQGKQPSALSPYDFLTLLVLALEPPPVPWSTDKGGE